MEGQSWRFGNYFVARLQMIRPRALDLGAAGHRCVALSPTLVIVAVWPSLPEPIRRARLALIG
jgi:hypothetical protein